MSLEVPQPAQRKSGDAVIVEERWDECFDEYPDDDEVASRVQSKRIVSPISLGSEFILTKANTVTELAHESGLTRIVTKVLWHPITGNCLGLLTLFDAYLSCADIDRRAAGREEPAWLSISMDLCLAAYTVEYVMWCYIKRLGVFRDKMLVVDLFIILCGFAEWVMSETMTGFLDNFNLLRMFRVARIIRLLKLFRRFSYLKELRKLLTMATTCMRTLCWSFIFCFVVMTIWAMLLVDLVQPLILKLHEDRGMFSDCEQCLRAASSVMDANLLLFKTVIAGDGWGTIAVPVIEAYPATAVIFVGSLLTLVFGVLNLIVAVVVDTFAEARERDVLNLAEEMETDIEMDKKFLQKIFDRVDEDGSGELTLGELIDGARKDPEFQSRLRVMDIDEADLQQLFQMIDTDGSGTVERNEFIQPLSRWVHESKTAPRFIKYNLMRSLHEQEQMKEMNQLRFDQLNGHLQRIAVGLGVPLARESHARQPKSVKRSLISDIGDLPSPPPKEVDMLEVCKSPSRKSMTKTGTGQHLEVPEKAGESLTSSASTEDLEKVHAGLCSMDFNNFTEYYKKKRSSRVEENLAQMGLLEESGNLSGLPPPGLNHLDDVLHSALEVAQELLSDATSAALVRAEHTLNLRLRGLMRAGMQADEGPLDEMWQHADDDEVRGLSPKCAAGHLGPLSPVSHPPLIEESTSEQPHSNSDTLPTLPHPALNGRNMSSRSPRPRGTREKIPV